MSKCKAGEVWTSFINGQYDGEFTIDQIGAQGFFTGRHGGDPIDGQCKGGRIWYHRGSSYYEGTYAGDDALSGTRMGLPLFARGKRISDDDEWVGTHTTLADSEESGREN
jgi:hypothetical protein